MLTLTPLCLSWSGFMEADSYVCGGVSLRYAERLHLVNSRLITDGGSSLYDGTPLVEQSVARVRTPSHSNEFHSLID